MIRAVLFDLGDTLLDFEPMDTRAVFWRAARSTYDRLAALGTRLPPFDTYVRDHWRNMRWAYLWAKITRREFNSLRLLEKFHRRRGLPADPRLLEELAWLWYLPLVDHTQIEEGLKSTLEILRGAGLKLGLISNTFVPGFVHDRHLEMVGLLEFFPVRIYSSETGFRKPDKRIFIEACRRLDVPPQRAMFVGDLVKTDVVGARRVGMKTAIKQPWSNPGSHRLADYVIRRISDLIPILSISAPVTSGALADSTFHHGATAESPDSA